VERHRFDHVERHRFDHVERHRFDHVERHRFDRGSCLRRKPRLCVFVAEASAGERCHAKAFRPSPR
jgi:hypothetical protein